MTSEESKPLVSVLMTAYNREKYIAEAIESVLASTYTNFELIIVDDRSADNSAEIAKSYAQKDLRVQVHVNEKNLGDYPNRNKAASCAMGKYIKYVDADDYIYPWGLELLVKMMEQFPDAGWGLCSLMQTVEKPYPFQLSPKQAFEHHYFGPGLFHKAPLSSIIKKRVFDMQNGFAPLRMVGDFEMWHRLALSFPVVLMPDGIVWYREHDSQEINSSRQFVVSYEKIMLQYLQNKSCPLSQDQAKYLITRRKIQAFRSMIFYLVKFRFKNAIDNAKIWFYYLSNRSFFYKFLIKELKVTKKGK